MIAVFLLVVTEGQLEVPVAQKVFDVLGIEHEETRFVPKGGGNAFWRDAVKYNKAARYAGPVLGIADLEQSPCPGGLIVQYLPHGRHPSFVLRIAVHMLEAWLLADRQAISSFLRVPVARIPNDPDNLPHAKRCLVNLARQSRKRQIVEDIVPSQGSEGVVGRGYTPRMTNFIRTAWRPTIASINSNSLRRALAAIQAIAA